MSQKKIAIVGGGIAGLTFARSLASSGYDIHIFEKTESFGEAGAAISVFPNALSVMDALGLLQKVLDSSGQFQKVFLKSDKGTVLSKSVPRGDYPLVCIHRRDLHKILLDGISANLHAGYAVKSLSSLDDKRIQLDFENKESAVFDGVVGADGIHSVVRQSVIADGKPIFRGYNCWRGVVETDFDIGYASETYGSGKRVGIVPVKDGVYGWWATCNEGFMEDDQPEGTKPKLKRLYGHWHHPIPELMQNTDTILKNSLADRKPHKGWSKGAVVLIGDAAHPTTPNLGQGGCIAIEGAFVLAKCIRKYGLTNRAFSRYEVLHYPRARAVVKQSLLLGKIGQWANPILVPLRNVMFRLTPSSIAMRMFGRFFNFRASELEV
ncbi:MAG: NAD(P)-binding protein [Bacteroidetes bacterium]|nr:NAD(P)-binding protein [Bacteroidota bacterium]